MFLEQTEIVFNETKTISQWKRCFRRNGTDPTGKKCAKNLELETLLKFQQHPFKVSESALQKRSNTMFRYTGYTQKTEHQEKPLRKIDHRSIHQCFSRG